MAGELSRITNPDNTAIDLYRSNDAAPQNLDQLRFWVINELRRIQDGFVSTDAVLKLLAGILEDLPTDGSEGEQGEQGPQGLPGKDGADGQDGQDGQDGTDSGDLINDSVVAYDLAWSSRKISNDLSGKANLNQLPTDPMQWMFGGYDGATLYLRNQALLINGWTMVANKETTEYPAPAPVGDPYWVLDDTDPGWAIKSPLGRLVISAHEYTFTNGGYTGGYRFYVPNVNVNTYYRVVIEDYSVPDDPDVLYRSELVQPTTVGWHEFFEGRVLVLPGSVYRVFLEHEDRASTITFNASYNYSSGNIDVTPTAGQAFRRNNRTWVRFDKIDHDLSTPALDQVSAGSHIRVAGISDWLVEGASESLTYWEYEISGSGNPADGLYSFEFEYPSIDVPQYYAENIDYWLNNPPARGSATGLLWLDGVEVGDPNTAYGVDILVQEAFFPVDWNVMAFSETVGGGGGSGEANDTQNLGGAFELALPKSGVNLPFRTLVAGSGININSNVDTLEIVNAGGVGGEANDSRNDGGGVAGLALPKDGIILPFRTLVEGANITLTEGADTVTIATASNADPYYLEVLSLLNFADQPDGILVTDEVTDPNVGNTWTSVNGAQVISGELVLDGINQHLLHEDTFGFRSEFDAAFSAYWTIEFKIVTGAVSQATDMMLLDWRNATSAKGLSLQIRTDNLFQFRVGDSDTGSWEIDEQSGIVALPSTEYEVSVAQGRGGYAWWINGVFQSLVQFGGLSDFGDAGFRLGSRSDFSSPFNGKYQRIRCTRKITRYLAADYTPEVGNSYAYP